MNIKLYNDDGQETLTDEGKEWSKLTENCLKNLVDKAIRDNVSLRELVSVVIDEIVVLTSTERILKGIKDREYIKENHPPKYVYKRAPLPQSYYDLLDSIG